MASDPNTQDVVLSALAASGDVLYVWDLTSDKIAFFGNTEYLFGSGAVVPDGASLRARLHADDVSQHPAMSTEIESGPYDRDYRIRRDDGEFCWVHDCGRFEPMPSDGSWRIAGSLRVITDRKDLEAGRQDSAVYDPLTGHYNRSRVREALDQAMSQARRYAQPGAFLVVGIDEFKTFAERHADRVRDQILVGVGRRLEDGIRSTDVIGRTDDRSFGIVLGRCDGAGIEAAARNIVDAVGASPIETAAGPIRVSVSVGTVLFPDVAKTATGAMRGAETAYRTAATRGSGQVELYRLTEHQVSRRSQQSVLGAALLEALRDERIALAYQPVVRSGDGSLAYHETLLRVVGETSGPFEAAVFIPVAEQLGHSRRIDRRVLELAVADLHRNPDIRLAINISGHTATDRSWLRLLTSLVKDRHQIAHRLTVEITETAEIHDLEEAYRLVSMVRQLGCRVALDDFGAGHTSFRQLKSLPFDIVKVDGGYIRGIAQDADNQAFLDDLLEYTKAFGIETVAECVETADDRDYLLTRGVTYFQGWMYGKPQLELSALRSQASPTA